MMEIRNILYVGAVLLMVACSGEDNLASDGTLSGEGKTPLQIEASLTTGTATMRAVDMQFDEDDNLLVYIRHTTGGSKGSYGTQTADQAPKLVTLIKGSSGMETTSDAQTQKTSDLSKIYWDDFSNSASAETDLHTSGHGLQSFYGYCYNGGTPTTALNAAEGTLGWTVQTNQQDNGSKTSDLLWSEEQETIIYAHDPGSRPTMTIPYTHAMSEITVTLTAGDGFTGNPFTNTELTLNGMNTVASLKAPTKTVSGSTTADIKMSRSGYSTGGTRNYTAIIAPVTKLKESALLLNIVNAAGDNYTLNITGTGEGGMLANTAWGADHELKTDDGNYILTKPGYNYHLDVTVNKTKIDVVAKLTNWSTVNATGTGVINYPQVDFDMSSLDNFANNSSIYLFRLQHGDGTDTPEERNDYGSHVTTSTYDGSKWTNNPAIYWPNGTDKFYFRALSQENTTVNQGTTDVLWGTTPAHDPYEEGAAIGPRKNEVPLAFKHAMSMVTFQLETESALDAAEVNLTNATIAISNLATSGTINLEDGVITPASVTPAAIPAENAPITERIVVPQTITDDAVVTITLADGTTYKLQLNKCVENAGTTPIAAWEAGKAYTYTIHLEKELMTFRALIKNWDEKSGNGNANLEWD